MPELPDSPITRAEQYLASVAGQSVTLPEEPITREELYLASIAGQETGALPEPITRKEQYLAYIAENGGGSSVEVEPLSVTENRTYSEEGKAYSPVVVNVRDIDALIDRSITEVRSDVTTIGRNAFRDCTELRSADFSSATSIGSNAFNGCTSLIVLVLDSSSVCTLSGINAFNNTPFASGEIGGMLYVPSALVSSYKEANFWSTMFGDGRAAGYANNQIFPL